ncbi:hypothetical protein PTM93_10040 [Clostridium perfringens]|nr:hypothetical protein [Clostridium perfringens]MDK0409777.1 hypothetical protein [Clostridium perfringens]MDK0443952.1 hypothetical protein [Clostridium perfringens]MDK0497637.1 hypothetical protein [Clostridium perfringens]MDK0500603.1 hypothetical protein [Clostridium perfringens]
MADWCKSLIGILGDPREIISCIEGMQGDIAEYKYESFDYDDEEDYDYDESIDYESCYDDSDRYFFQNIDEIYKDFDHELLEESDELNENLAMEGMLIEFKSPLAKHKEYSFNAVLKVPQEILDSEDAVFKWQVENWGSKLDTLNFSAEYLNSILNQLKGFKNLKDEEVYELIKSYEEGKENKFDENIEIVENKTICASFCLFTPWDPPYNWLYALNKKFPNIDVLLYEDECEIIDLEDIF